MTTEHKVIVRHSSIIINNYELGDDSVLEGMLSVWDPVYFQNNPVGYYYDEEKKQLRLPRGVNLSRLERMFNTQCHIDYNHSDFEKTSVRLTVEPRNDIQRKAISFLVGHGEFEYTKKYSQQSLTLDTGDGKTYCVIAALSFLNMRSMIITPRSNLKDQWKASILKMTSMDENYIYDISGTSDIKKLLKMKKITHKVFLVNHQTIQSYAKSNGWLAVEELFSLLRIGLKVYDEAHEQFSNINHIDFHTNVKKTIYLTANFERSDHKENKVFSLCFKNIPKFGIETREMKRKHLIVVIVEYNSKPPLDVQMLIKGRYGFDKNRYIDYQLTTDIFYDALKYICDYIGDKEGKMLLTFSKTDAIDQVYNYMEKNYDKRIPFKYNSKVTEDDKIKALNSDLILSTPKSLGTGSDIPGLRFVINTEQYSSSITANQLSGRLREYSPDEYTFYFEMIDVGFSQTSKMLAKRLAVFKKKAKLIHTLKLDKNILNQ